jgi:nitrous oxide reductase accessory protein NosL
MKKRIVYGVLVMALLSLGGLALANPQEDVSATPSCQYCGMDRHKFAHSRMVIEYDDGTKVGVCSLHCAAIDLSLNIDKTPKIIWVADYNTKMLIDAEKATWIMDPAKPGVMTRTAKWAFAKKEDAEKFTKENGGHLAAFEECLKAAYEGMYADLKMIRDKRKGMKMKPGENTHKAQ